MPTQAPKFRDAIKQYREMTSALNEPVNPQEYKKLLQDFTASIKVSNMFTRIYARKTLAQFDRTAQLMDDNTAKEMRRLVELVQQELKNNVKAERAAMSKGFMSFVKGNVSNDKDAQALYQTTENITSLAKKIFKWSQDNDKPSASEEIAKSMDTSPSVIESTHDKKSDIPPSPTDDQTSDYWKNLLDHITTIEQLLEPNRENTRGLHQRQSGMTRKKPEYRLLSNDEANRSTTSTINDEKKKGFDLSLLSSLSFFKNGISGLLGRLALGFGGIIAALSPYAIPLAAIGASLWAGYKVFTRMSDDLSHAAEILGETDIDWTEKFSVASGSLAGSIGALVDWGAGLFGIDTDYEKTWRNTVANAIDDMIDSVEDIIVDSVKWLKDVKDGFFKWFDEKTDWLVKTGESLYKKGSDFVENGIKTAESVKESVYTTIEKTMEDNLPEGLVKSLKSIRESISNSVKHSVVSITNTVKEIFPATVEAIVPATVSTPSSITSSNTSSSGSTHRPVSQFVSEMTTPILPAIQTTTAIEETTPIVSEGVPTQLPPTLAPKNPTHAMIGTEASVSNLIHLGESKRRGYNDYNRGSDKRAASNRMNIDLENMTIKELRAHQALPIGHKDRIFAAGKYQIVKDTMTEAVQALHLDENQKFDAKTQEYIFTQYLTRKKRQDMEDYITGKSKNLVAAEHATAQEWASIESGLLGRGVYDKVGNNKAHISSKQMSKSLKEAREKYANLKAQGLSHNDAYAQALGTSYTNIKDPNAKASTSIIASTDTVKLPPTVNPTTETNNQTIPSESKTDHSSGLKENSLKKKPLETSSTKPVSTKIPELVKAPSHMKVSLKDKPVPNNTDNSTDISSAIVQNNQSLYAMEKDSVIKNANYQASVSSSMVDTSSSTVSNTVKPNVTISGVDKVILSNPKSDIYNNVSKNEVSKPVSVNTSLVNHYNNFGNNISQVDQSTAQQKASTRPNTTKGYDHIPYAHGTKIPY